MILPVNGVGFFLLLHYTSEVGLGEGGCRAVAAELILRARRNWKEAKMISGQMSLTLSVTDL